MNDPIVANARSDTPQTSSGGLEAGVQIGDFCIERRLGAGGMGIVYQARQISLNRRVALKVLGQALTQAADVTRFQREAQAAARLRHPSIAQVYFIGQDRHICYMAMELVEGISLRRVLDRLGTTSTSDTGLDTVVQEDLTREPDATAIRFDVPTEDFPSGTVAPATPQGPASAIDINPHLTPNARELRTSQAHVRRCAEVIREAAEALVHAHEQGVVHRDIKPDNLLLDRRGKLHLIDFGVARFFEDQAVTYTGQLVGTPLYMSPEQVTGRGAIDCRTDIYSLGLVLYELLTLRPSVEAANRENLFRNIVTKPLPPLAWRNEAVPEDLARIAHRATQKDPDQRYSSAADMAADLDRFLSGKSVAAPPYHYRLDEREIKAARPGGIVLAAFVILLVAAILSLGIASVGLMTMFMGVQNYFGMMILAVQFLVAAVILAGGVLVGRGLLGARTWARWTGVALFVSLSIGSALGLVGLAMMILGAEQLAEKLTDVSTSQARGEPTFQAHRFIYGMLGMYALPLFAALLLAAAGIWSLLARNASEWFAFAAQLRLEHRSVREQLK